MKIRLGSNRSGRPSSALTRVPTTKPACTALVSSATSNPESGVLRAKVEAAAADANHTAIAATWAMRRMPIDGHFP